MRDLDQKRLDRDRITYRITFPHELGEESVTAWVRSISGTLRGTSMRFSGSPTIGFELWATAEGIQHRLKVPWQHADYVIAQLRSLVPGIRVMPEDEWPTRQWTRAVEVGLSRPTRPLRIFSAADMASSLLASVQALGKGETVVVQWVVTPAVPNHKPLHKETRSDMFHPRHLINGNLANKDEVAERRAKLDEPNMLAVLRVGAVAETDVRADHLIHRVRASLASTRTATNKFTRRRVTKVGLQGRISAAAGCLHYPAQLSAPELAALVAWPVGGPFVTGLPRPTGRQFPPHGAVAQQGIILGDSSFPGQERPVAVGYDEALMHTHVLGKTGVGKSVLLAHMARQIMAAGHGLILMETEGNLYQSVLDYVPRERVKDVVLFDLSDERFPVGFNVLDQGHAPTVIDEILDLFQHKFGKDGMGIWSQEYIYHGLRTIAEIPNLTFVDIVTLLNPHTSEEVEWVDQVTRAIRDPELQRWWQRHDNRDKRSQQQRADPVLSRVWQLASRPELRFILGQAKSTFQVRDILRENKILLINLKGVSRDTASLTGTLLMNAIWHAAKSVSTDKTGPTFLLLDEFADFMDLPIDTESMLAQARKHKLGMVLANQHMSQLKPAVRDAVISNARNKVIFQANADDGTVLARHMAGEVTPNDITHLQTYEAIASVLTPIGSSGPVSISTRGPGRSTNVANAVRSFSRATYGHPISEVRKLMEARYQKPDVPNTKRRPKTSAWGDDVDL